DPRSRRPRPLRRRGGARPHFHVDAGLRRPDLAERCRRLPQRHPRGARVRASRGGDAGRGRAASRDAGRRAPGPGRRSVGARGRARCGVADRLGAGRDPPPRRGHDLGAERRGDPSLPGGSRLRMSGEHLVCFAKDWDDHPTSNNHVMRLLARRNRVLWVSSIGMRRPRASARDLRRIVRKLGASLRGPHHVADGLWVLAPLVLPLPHSDLATALNRRLLRATIRRAARRLGMETFQVWTFLPNTVDYATDLDPTLLVYYCVDDWAHAEGYDGPALAALERRLCARADVVFATSTGLVRAKRRWNANTHLAAHGVDHAHFARALDPATPTAPEVARLAGPVVGVVGLLDERVDTALLAHVAARRPDWSIALIGRAHVDL